MPCRRPAVPLLGGVFGGHSVAPAGPLKSGLPSGSEPARAAARPERRRTAAGEIHPSAITALPAGVEGAGLHGPGPRPAEWTCASPRSRSAGNGYSIRRCRSANLRCHRYGSPAFVPDRRNDVFARRCPCSGARPSRALPGRRVLRSAWAGRGNRLPYPRYPADETSPEGRGGHPDVRRPGFDVRRNDRASSGGWTQGCRLRTGEPRRQRSRASSSDAGHVCRCRRPGGGPGE